MAAIKDINYNDGQAEFDFKRSTPGEFLYKIGDSIECRIQGIGFDMTSENCALLKKVRLHQYMEVEGFWVDYKAIIPFGSEPMISRKFEAFRNYCRIATCVSMNTGFPFQDMQIDKVSLKGKWTDVGLVEFDQETKSLQLKWQPVEAGKPVAFYRDSKPFIACLLKTASGEQLEIGQGNDLWRWQVAAGVQAESEFQIEIEGDEAVVSRMPIRWQEEMEQKRDWRFKWYLAWGKAENQFPQIDDVAELPQDLSQFKYNKGNAYRLPQAWQDNAKVMLNEEKQGSPCYQASIVKRYLKNWVRVMLKHLNGDTIYLCGLQPHFCTDAAHLERPRKKYLEHWDLQDIIEFQFWANKQLAQLGARLVLVPEAGSVGQELPSLNSLF